MSTATASTGSGVNLQALLLAIGIDNKELESELFVGNIEMGLAYNALAMDSANDAYDHNIDSADNAFYGRMVGAGASAASAGANVWGMHKAGQFKCEKGSPEFQNSVAKSDANIANLTKQRDSLAGKTLASSTPGDGKTTIGEGEASTDVPTNGKTLGEATQADYDGWKTDRAKLQQEIDSGDLSTDEVAYKQQKIDKLDSDIKDYEELQGVDSQIAVAESEFANVKAKEQHRQAENSQMKWKAIGEVLKSACEVGAAILDRKAKIQTAKAGLDEAEHSWRSKVADSFNQLANDHFSNSNGIDQYINNAVQTTQQVFNELCKVVG